MKAWSPKVEININAIASLLIWIQLLELAIKYWGMQSLSNIESVLDIPLKTNKYTKEKSMLKNARLLVKISLKGHFPKYIEFANERNVIIRQKVMYEWIPIKCSHCRMFDHI